MCKGSFGGYALGTSEPHEYICVQSMDGMLSIFEYESYSLSCFLPNALLPGPLKYLSRNDSFVTVSSTWHLESYRYQTLATQTTSEKGDKIKKIQPEWSFNIGEGALAIELTNNGSTVLVLGERNLFGFSDTLSLKFIKKFDYNPSAFCVYQTGAQQAINFLISTHAKLLFVHEEVRVKWATQFDHVPVQIAVAKVNNLKGVIVTLSESGHLSCAYLGTDQAFSNVLQVPEEKVFNFTSAESEYRSLQLKIKEAIMNTGSVVPSVKTSGKAGLIINAEVPPKLDSIARTRDTEVHDNEPVPSITVKLQLKSSEMLHNVKLTVNCIQPIVAVPDSLSYGSVGGAPIEQDILFYMKSKHVPSSLSVTVVATYNLFSVNGESRVVEHKFRLPLKLVAKSLSQQQMRKQTQYKVIIDTSKSCMNIADLFPEFSAASAPNSGSNSISLQYFGGFPVSIQASKSSNRYRLQSDSFESMWLITHEFTNRLSSHFKTNKDFGIAFQDNLPIDEYREIMDKHLQLRMNADRLKEMIEQCSVQFRAIQKRLLNKFKDKTPTSLDNMDALLEATYRQICTLADRYESNQIELSLASQALACATSLYGLLVSLSQNITKEEAELLDTVLTPQFFDTPDLVIFEFNIFLI